ncbi:hypothetical protein QT971_20225 [Microcoleus sp. herbarium19]|uniref:hypothetical protein n=1 Tax=unclassified Microcoleus TaxID=2642155 RepID=UPI002FD664D9
MWNRPESLLLTMVLFGELPGSNRNWRAIDRRSGDRIALTLKNDSSLRNKEP